MGEVSAVHWRSCHGQLLHEELLYYVVTTGAAGSLKCVLRCSPRGHGECDKCFNAKEIIINLLRRDRVKCFS